MLPRRNEMRRVSSKEFIRQDMMEKYEEMDHDVDFDEADQSQQQLSLFWQNVQRGISVLERHQRNGEDVSHKYVISDDIDPDELRRLWLFNPNGRWKIWWEVMLGFIVMYSIIAIPFEIGFNVKSTIMRRIVSSIFTAFFGLDIFFSFNTAFINPSTKRFEVDRWKIAEHYLSFWFWIDIIATIPFDAILAGLLVPSQLQVVRLIRVLRLMRLSKLYRLLEVNKAFETYVDPAVINLVILFARIFYIAHLFACLWHYISLSPASDGFPETWTRVTDVDLTSTADRYIASMYFAVVTLLTIGYGDVTATNEVERFVAIVTMVAGVVVFATLVNRLSTIIASRNADVKLFKQKVDQFKTDLRAAKIPSLLAKRARLSLTYYLKKRTTAKESEILKDLPSSIRRELVRRIYREDLERVKFLHSVDSSFVVDIIVDSRPFRAYPGEILFNEGDLCKDFVFVKSGLVEMSIHVPIAGVGLEGNGGVQRPVGCVLEGGFFGDTEWHYRCTCVATYLARNHCYMLLISQQCIEQAIKRNATTSQALKDSIKTRAQNLMYTIEQVRMHTSEVAALRKAYTSMGTAVSTPHPDEGFLSFNYELAHYVWMDGKVVKLGHRRIALDHFVEEAMENNPTLNQQQPQQKLQASKNHSIESNMSKVRCLMLVDNKAKVVERNVSELRRHYYLILPWDKGKIAWDLVISLITFACMLIIPPAIVFTQDGLSRSVAFDIVVNIFFLVDIVLTFFTSTLNVEYEAVVISHQMIAKQYVFSIGFYIDVVSALPLGIILAALRNPQTHGSSGGTTASYVLRSIRILKLARLLRMFRLSQHISKLEDMTGISPLTLSLIKTVLKTFIIAHWMACLWWGLTSIVSRSPWFTEYGPDNPKAMVYGRLQGELASAQYLASLYYIFATLTTTGYGDIRPNNTPERVITIILAFIGVIAFSYTVAGISNAFNTFVSTDTVLKEKISQVRNYLHEKQCPLDLKLQILNQYERKLREVSYEDIRDILKQLPQMVSTNILQMIYRQKMAQIPLFSYVRNASIQVYLFQCMTPLICEEGYHLYRQGKVVRELFFLIEGGAVAYRKRRGPAPWTRRYNQQMLNNDLELHVNHNNSHAGDTHSNNITQREPNRLLLPNRSTYAALRSNNHDVDDDGIMSNHLSESRQDSGNRVAFTMIEEEQAKEPCGTISHREQRSLSVLSDVTLDDKTPVKAHSRTITNSLGKGKSSQDIVNEVKDNQSPAHDLHATNARSRVMSRARSDGSRAVSDNDDDNEEDDLSSGYFDEWRPSSTRVTPALSVAYNIYQPLRIGTKAGGVHTNTKALSPPVAHAAMTQSMPEMESPMIKQIRTLTNNIHATHKISHTTSTYQPDRVLQYDDVMRQFRSGNVGGQVVGTGEARVSLGLLSPLQLLGAAVHSHDSSSVNGRDHDKQQPEGDINIDSFKKVQGDDSSARQHSSFHPNDDQHRSLTLKTYVLKHGLSLSKLQARDFLLLNMEKLSELYPGEFAGHLAFLLDSVTSHSKTGKTANGVNKRGTKGPSMQHNQSKQSLLEASSPLKTPTRSSQQTSLHSRHLASMAITKPSTVYTLSRNDILRILQQDPAVAFELQHSLVASTTFQLLHTQRKAQKRQRMHFLELLRIRFLKYLWRRMEETMVQAQKLVMENEEVHVHAKTNPTARTTSIMVDDESLDDGIILPSYNRHEHPTIPSIAPSNSSYFYANPMIGNPYQSGVANVLSSKKKGAHILLDSRYDGGDIPSPGLFSMASSTSLYASMSGANSSDKQRMLYAKEVVALLPVFQRQKQLIQRYRQTYYDGLVTILKAEGIPVYTSAAKADNALESKRSEVETDSSEPTSNKQRQLTPLAEYFLFHNPWDVSDSSNSTNYHMEVARLQEHALKSTKLHTIFAQEIDRLHALDLVLLQERTQKHLDDDYHDMVRKKLIKKAVHSTQTRVLHKMQKWQRHLPPTFFAPSRRRLMQQIEQRSIVSTGHDDVDNRAQLEPRAEYSRLNSSMDSEDGAVRNSNRDMLRSPPSPPRLASPLISKRQQDSSSSDIHRFSPPSTPVAGGSPRTPHSSSSQKHHQNQQLSPSRRHFRSSYVSMPVRPVSASAKSDHSFTNSSKVPPPSASSNSPVTNRMRSASYSMSLAMPLQSSTTQSPASVLSPASQAMTSPSKSILSASVNALKQKPQQPLQHKNSLWQTQLVQIAQQEQVHKQQQYQQQYALNLKNEAYQYGDKTRTSRRRQQQRMMHVRANDAPSGGLAASSGSQNTTPVVSMRLPNHPISNLGQSARREDTHVSEKESSSSSVVDAPREPISLAALHDDDETTLVSLRDLTAVSPVQLPPPSVASNNTTTTASTTTVPIPREEHGMPISLRPRALLSAVTSVRRSFSSPDFQRNASATAAAAALHEKHIQAASSQAHSKVISPTTAAQHSSQHTPASSSLVLAPRRIHMERAASTANHINRQKSVTAASTALLMSTSGKSGKMMALDDSTLHLRSATNPHHVSPPSRRPQRRSMVDPRLVEHNHQGTTGLTVAADMDSLTRERRTFVPDGISDVNGKLDHTIGTDGAVTAATVSSTVPLRVGEDPVSIPPNPAHPNHPRPTNHPSAQTSTSTTIPSAASASSAFINRRRSLSDSALLPARDDLEQGMSHSSTTSNIGANSTNNAGYAPRENAMMKVLLQRCDVDYADDNDEDNSHHQDIHHQEYARWVRNRKPAQDESSIQHLLDYW